MATLSFYKTHPDIILPEFATTQAACFDLAFQVNGKTTYKGFSRHNKPFERPFKNGVTMFFGPNERILVPTGLILDIPKEHSVRIHPRSGISLKQGLVLANSEGIIDSDYVDELYLLMFNMSENVHTIENCMRLAQGEMIQRLKYTITEAFEPPTRRGNRTGGMGSTGTQINAANTSNTKAD